MCPVSSTSVVRGTYRAPEVVVGVSTFTGPVWCDRNDVREEVAKVQVPTSKKVSKIPDTR